MPLFECTKCGTVDNTAMGGYWCSTLSETNEMYSPALCVECKDGTWHGEFPKQKLTGTDMVLASDGFVYHEEEIKRGGYFYHLKLKVVRKESIC